MATVTIMIADAPQGILLKLESDERLPDPGEDGDYSYETDPAAIRPYIDAITQAARAPASRIHGRGQARLRPGG